MSWLFLLSWNKPETNTNKLQNNDGIGLDCLFNDIFKQRWAHSTCVIACLVLTNWQRRDGHEYSQGRRDREQLIAMNMVTTKQ